MPTPPPHRLSRRDLRRRGSAMSRGDKAVMAVLLPAGITLFIATEIANFSGHELFSWDPHHFFGQVGGMALIVVAVTRWR
jgi:hypothetical protein